MKIVAKYLAYSDDPLPLSQNKTSLFGKKIKLSFMGSTIMNYFTGKFENVDKQKAMIWVEGLTSEGFFTLEHGETKWKPTNIYSLGPATNVLKEQVEETGSPAFNVKTETEEESASVVSSGGDEDDSEKGVSDKKSLYNFLLEFLKKNYTHQISNFIWQCKHFQKIEDKKVRKFKAKEIFKSFLDPKDTNSIFLPSYVKFYVKDKHSSAKPNCNFLLKKKEQFFFLMKYNFDIFLKVFDNAIKEALSLLSTNPFKKFLDDDAYQKFLDKRAGVSRSNTIPFKGENVSHPDYINRYFEVILVDTVKRQFFREFLKMERNDENILYYSAVNEFESKSYSASNNCSSHKRKKSWKMSRTGRQRQTRFITALLLAMQTRPSTFQET